MISPETYPDTLLADARKERDQARQEKATWALETYVFPSIGSKYIASIAPHHAGLTKPVEVGQLLRDVEGYTGRRLTVLAMRFGHLTFARPKELRMAERDALRRLGYSNDEMTGQGVRTMASTLLNEQGWPADAIEKQLSHIEENEVRGAHNQAKYLPIRRQMMQFWADYLDELRKGNTGSVTHFERVAASHSGPGASAHLARLQQPKRVHTINSRPLIGAALWLAAVLSNHIQLMAVDPTGKHQES